MLKRGLSVFLASALLILCFFSVPVFAEDPEFDISNYTWEDIMTMNNEEFQVLLANFERVYDPFGTYNTNPLAQKNTKQSDFGVQPLWISGEEDLSATGSHELITARACGVLLSDKGFWGENHNGSILVALTLSLASIKPDKEWLLGPVDLFKGHFYDPDTGKNWAGSSINTARSNTEKFYKLAKEEYIKNANSTKFIEYVGKMLHYIQDANEPHHAANITALERKNVHTKFEEYADQNLNTCIDSLTSLNNTQYSNSLLKSPGDLVHEGALTAKSYSYAVLDVDSTEYWFETAWHCSRNAVQYSVLLLYKISVDTNISLTK